MGKQSKAGDEEFISMEQAVRVAGNEHSGMFGTLDPIDEPLKVDTRCQGIDGTDGCTAQTIAALFFCKMERAAGVAQGSCRTDLQTKVASVAAEAISQASSRVRFHLALRWCEDPGDQ